MAVVRELVTLLDFKLEGGGLEQANAGVLKLKASIMSLGKLFGIYLAADKIYEVVDGLISAGKEINKIKYQMDRMARSGDDTKQAQKDLFDIAQNVGESYTHVLDVYREFLNESKDSNVSQDQLLHTVDNIYKGLRLSAASGEQMDEVFSTLNRGFRMGRIGMRQFGLLVDNARDVMDALGEGTGKTRAQLEEMAKAGTLTADFLITGLGKAIPFLERDFANRPRKLGEALTYAWNEAANLSAEIWKVANTTKFMAKQIVLFTQWVKRNVEALGKQFGGLGQTLEMIGYVVAVVVILVLLRMFTVAAFNTVVWIAKNFLLAASYLAVVAALLAIFLLIDDIVHWVKGDQNTVMEDMFGPFEAFAEGFKKVWDESAVMAPFKAFQLFVEGDFAGAWEKVKQAMDDTVGQIGLVIVALGVLWAVMRLFNVLKFVWFLGEIAAASIAALGPVKKLTAAITALNAATGVSWLARLGKLGVAAGAIWAGIEGRDWMQSGFDWLLGRSPEEIAKREQQRTQTDTTGGNQLWNFIDRFMNPPIKVKTPPPQTGAGTVSEPAPPAPQTGTGTTPAPAPLPPSISPMWDILRSAATFGGMPVSVAPGQVAPIPGATQNDNRVVNQTNNVEIQFAPTLGLEGTADGFKNIMNDFGRQIRNAVPVVEKPTQ